MNLPPREAVVLAERAAAASRRDGTQDAPQTGSGPQAVFRAAVWQALAGAVDDTPVGRLIVAGIEEAAGEYAAALVEESLRGPYAVRPVRKAGDVA